MAEWLRRSAASGMYAHSPIPLETGSRGFDSLSPLFIDFMNKWERIYKEEGDFFKEPSIEAVKAVNFFKSEGLKKILDLGCGTGRHTKLIKEAGMDTYGCDISSEGVKKTKEKAHDCDVRICDMKSLPYDDGFFDGVFSVNVLEHGVPDEIRLAINEAFRVLRKGGVLFAKVLSTEHWKYKTGTELEPFTKKDTGGFDADIHHFFTEKTMHDFFKDFDIIKIYIVKNESETDPREKAANWIIYARKK